MGPKAISLIISSQSTNLTAEETDLIAECDVGFYGLPGS